VSKIWAPFEKIWAPKTRIDLWKELENSPAVICSKKGPYPWEEENGTDPEGDFVKEALGTIKYQVAWLNNSSLGQWNYNNSEDNFFYGMPNKLDLKNSEFARNGGAMWVPIRECTSTLDET
jgi:hypothetical protein